MQPERNLDPRFREDDIYTKILILLKIYVELRLNHILLKIYSTAIHLSWDKAFLTHHNGQRENPLLFFSLILYSHLPGNHIRNDLFCVLNQFLRH